jgi:hypothetical protein
MTTPPQRQGPQSYLWLLAVAAGAGALLTALVGGSVYLVVRLTPAKAAPVAAKSDTPTPQSHPSSAPDPDTPTVRPVVPKATERADPKPADPPAPNERLMEALGGLTAGQVYQAYLNIGLLADAWEKDVYPEEDAYKMLATVARLIEAVDGQLAGLADGEMKPDDRKALARSRELLALLRTQAKELESYWKTGEKEHADKFHKARETAWSGIKELLGKGE